MRPMSERRKGNRRPTGGLRVAAAFLSVIGLTATARAQTSDVGAVIGSEVPETPAHAGAGEAPATQAADADATAAIAAAAEEAVEAPASDEPADSAGDAPTRLEALIELDRLLDEEQYEEAVPVGEQLLRLTRQQFGDESLEAAEAYVSLARAEREAGKHEESEQNYLHGIDLIRSIDGNFSERAIDPLVGLGDNYQESGQYVQAVTSYNEARTISRRVFGLLNEAQIPILDKITESFVELNQYQDADAQQLDILRLAERNYPQGSPGYLDGIYRYAEWLRKTGRYNEEREQYDQAIRIIRDEHGKDSALLVKPMREMGNSFRLQRIPDNRGVGALKQALEILEMQPSPAPLLQAEVLRDLGDWEVAFSQGEPDLDAYVEAWQALGAVDDGEALRKEWFGGLESVIGEPISQRGLSRDPAAAHGYVIVQFDIDEYGQTHNVRVVKSDPTGFKDDAVARAVGRWRFRPFMEDGAIVPKDQLALRFNYRYMPGDEDQDA